MKYIVGQNVCLQPSVGIDYGWAFCMKYIQQLDMLAISKPKKQNWENFLEYCWLDCCTLVILLILSIKCLMFLKLNLFKILNHSNFTDIV